MGVTRRTGPRAVGVRTPYDAVPARVRRWVEDTLGSPVVGAHEQVGGMSPGCATRVVCADGTRAFVKAVGSELNPDTPTLFRREALVLEQLGPHPAWAALLASYDDGAWVGLLLEDVEGTHPDLSDEAVMQQLLAQTDELGESLRVRAEPSVLLGSGAVSGDGFATFADRATTWASFFDELGDLDAPTDRLPGWLRDGADRFRDQVAELASYDGGQLQHWDIRDDNLLQRPSGEIVFVDWGMALVGPPWLDPLLARLERVEDPWFDASVATSPTLVAAGDDRVTAWLLGLGTTLAVRSLTAVDVNLPTLNDFRIRESGRLLGAVARRLGLPA